jgi:tRNA1(Val) A37 N6-methylase TrmN6
LSDLRLDDLQFNNLKLYQDPAEFCFGSDAVELAGFVPKGKDKALCDIGAGSGILSVLLAAKKGYRVTAVEIQNRAYAILQKNIALNGLENAVTAVNMPIQEFCESSVAGAFSAVVCNPPYQPLGSGEGSCAEAVRIARFEEKLTLAEAVCCAARLLKFGGRFYMVHKSERLAEAIALCGAKFLVPKVLQILRPSKNKPPHLFLLMCQKNAGAGLKILSEREVGAGV